MLFSAGLKLRVLIGFWLTGGPALNSVSPLLKRMGNAVGRKKQASGPHDFVDGCNHCVVYIVSIEVFERFCLSGSQCDAGYGL